MFGVILLAHKNVIWQMHRLMLPRVAQQIIKKHSQGEQKEKPLLAEDQLQELERSLRLCLHSSQPARFFYYSQGVIKSVFGVPLSLKGNKLFLSHSSGKLELPLEAIVDISL